jgi:hypothetical protein
MQKLRICPGGVRAGSSCSTRMDKKPLGVRDGCSILADGCRQLASLLEFRLDLGIPRSSRK